jgi:hypothetical protein
VIRMSGGYDWDGGAERTESVSDSLRAVIVARTSSPSIPHLTSTLLVPTTIPSSRAVGADVVRPMDVVRPLRPARGTRPMIPSSLNRAGLLSTMRDRSRPIADASDVDASLHAALIDASVSRLDGALHDPNNEAPAARRSPLAIAGTATRNPTASNPRGNSGSRRGLPSSLSQRAHMFASIRDRSRLPILDTSRRSVEQPADGELSEKRTPEE